MYPCDTHVSTFSSSPSDELLQRFENCVCARVTRRCQTTKKKNTVYKTYFKQTVICTCTINEDNKMSEYQNNRRYSYDENVCEISYLLDDDGLRWPCDQRLTMYMYW